MHISAIDGTSFGRVITDKSGDKYLNRQLGHKKAREFKAAQKKNNVADIHVEGEKVYVTYCDKKYHVKNHLIENKPEDEVIYEDNSTMNWAYDGKECFTVAPWDYDVALECLALRHKSAPISQNGTRGIFVSETTKYPHNYGKGKEVFTNAELIATECKHIADRSGNKQDAIDSRFLMQEDKFFYFLSQE